MLITTPFAASIATLTAVPVACLAASGVHPGGATLLGAGLAGLAGLTLVSERWRRGHGPIPADAEPSGAPTVPATD
jgi:hypothetical protein